MPAGAAPEIWLYFLGLLFVQQVFVNTAEAQQNTKKFNPVTDQSYFICKNFLMQNHAVLQILNVVSIKYVQYVGRKKDSYHRA